MPEANNRNENNPEPDENKDQEPMGFKGGGNLPVRSIAFWAVLFVLIPVSLGIMFYNAEEKVETWTASKFEKVLLSGKILRIDIVKEPGSGIQKITGKFDYNGEEKSFETKVVYSDELDALLRKWGGEREVKVERNLISNVLLSIFPVLLLVGLFYFLFSRQMKSAGKGAFQFGKSRARMISPDQGKVTFADVSGITEAKEEMQEVVDFLRDPRKFQKLGGRIPSGVLMVGPPGTGKTLLARAIAGEAEVPFFSISGSDFVEMFVGVGASRVRDMFEEGKKNAPCIIFIDEIDSVGRSRGAGLGGGHDEREQTLNALLVEMDGFEKNTGVIVIAATNRPDVLDSALLRPGRFDRQITIDLPDLRGRLGIIKLKVANIQLAEGVNLETIARGTSGFSGADIDNLVNEAALLAARQDKPAVELCDLEEARDKVCWGKERRSRKIDEKDRKITAYHEAGHALVGMMSESSMPLHKVTIIPRGVAYLGATMHLPSKESYTQSRSELDAHLAMSMGGRVAEKLVFGEVTSGAAADIQQSTSIARKMVCQWGMSEKMGALCYSQNHEHVFLGREIAQGQELSPETAREIDREIRHIIDTAELQATDILTRESDRLKRFAEALLERETLDAKEIYELLDLEYKVEESMLEPIEDEIAESEEEKASGDGDTNRMQRLEEAFEMLSQDATPDADTAPDEVADVESAASQDKESPASHPGEAQAGDTPASPASKPQGDGDADALTAEAQDQGEKTESSGDRKS